MKSACEGDVLSCLSTFRWFDEERGGSRCTVLTSALHMHHVCVCVLQVNITNCTYEQNNAATSGAAIHASGASQLSAK
jgi:predicted outer membrane repeat protein